MSLGGANAVAVTLAGCQLRAGLNAIQFSVSHELDLTGSTFRGPIDLKDSRITGQLSCRAAHLCGADDDGDALIGDRMKVGASLYLDQGLVVAGAVRLPRVEVAGQLSCRGATLSAVKAESVVLNCAGIKVGGDLLLDRDFEARGPVSLAEAKIEGAVNLRDAKLLGQGEALSAKGLQVEHEFVWAPNGAVSGSVDLERATVHRLDDFWPADRTQGYWPPTGKLRLAGFKYEGFGGESQPSVQNRLEWIRKSHTTTSGDRAFVASPYEQLARVYRLAGQDADARKVAIARRVDRRAYSDLTWWQWFSDWFLDKTIKYGYQTWRALLGLIVLYVAALALLVFAQHGDNIIVPARPIANIAPTPSARACSPGYPCFYPAAYAVDVVVPIVKVGQSEYWRINGTASWGFAYLTICMLATGVGWALTTLAVVGYTGLVRKD
jgi:hypothetical protein